MTSWRVVLLLISATLLPTTFGFATPAPEELTAPLPEILHDVSPTRLLELTRADGGRAEGYVVTTLADSLVLRDSPTSSRTRSYALQDIARVREWRSNAGTGATVGAASGGFIVGSFGLLASTYLASINSSHKSDTSIYIVGTGVGIAIGALAGGTLGLGVGALSSSWHDLWPTAGVKHQPEINPYSTATRLGLFAGAGTTLADEYEVTRFVGRASLRKNVGQNLSLGPEISYHDFGSTLVAEGPNGSYQRSIDDVLKFALVANIRRQAPGLTPYGTLGVGWFLSNDAYLGGHAGGGLRWQKSRGHDLELDLRYHFSLTDVDRSEVDRFWTLGVGFGFGL